MQDRDTLKGFTGGQVLLALLSGAAAGAAIMYLNAPRTGDESRARLQAAVDDARVRVSQAPHALREASEAAQKAFTETLMQQLDGGAA